MLLLKQPIPITRQIMMPIICEISLVKLLVSETWIYYCAHEFCCLYVRHDKCSRKSVSIGGVDYSHRYRL